MIVADLTHGMSIAEVEAFGRKLASGYAGELRVVAQQVDRTLPATSWVGPDAEKFRAWWPSKRAALLAAADDLEEFGQAALRNAAEQRSTSEERGGAGGLVRPSGEFPSFGSPRADMIEAFWATGDDRRAAFDEIEIRQLANGNWVVVLPGVSDLSNADTSTVAGNFLRGDVMRTWTDGEHRDTSRLMMYANAESMDATDTFANPYAVRVREAMIAAGVPKNADVMLIGHSFGAYTAMELAGDPSFNSHGPFGDYHVNVTHVLAAGADTSWKLAEVPPGTSALILNNRADLAFRAEDPIQPDFAPVRDNQLNIEFWGEANTAHWGHAPSEYVRFLTEATDRPDLATWLDGAGSMYGGPGTAVAVRVPGGL